QITITPTETTSDIVETETSTTTTETATTTETTATSTSTVTTSASASSTTTTSSTTATTVAVVPAGFTLSAISGNTTETGGTATFTMKLNAKPTANVVIPLSSSNTIEGTVSPASLTFTASNWNTLQTVTVTGVDDLKIDGNVAYSIVTGAASSTDSNYNGLNPEDVSVTNTDNDIMWTTARQMGTAGEDSSRSVAVDKDGNVYLAGLTSSSLDGQTYIGGSYDATVIKYNSLGVKQWTKLVGTDQYDIATAITVDNNGNIYITGITTGTFPGKTNIGANESFLAKLDSSGNLIFTQEWGQYADDGGRGIAVDNSGNIYIAGYSQYGDNSVGPCDLGTCSNYASYVAKFDASTGTKLWLYRFGSDGQQGFGITVDSNGNIYATGANSDGLGTCEVGACGGNDMYVVKYNSSGTKAWTKRYGSAAHEYGWGITSDSSGNVYVTGQTTGAFPTSNAGAEDIFLIKLDSSGSNQWVKQMGTVQSDIGNGISVDSNGNVYVTGYTGDALDSQSNAGGRDVFLVKYDSVGTKQWTKLLGSTSDDEGMGVTVDSGGNIFATGQTKGGLDGNTYGGASLWDLFVTKYAPDGTR
ncbi:MAG: SBBP repeat-containing protein, partial [SAR324 cluster bacterium]|nr:SBBP repeat-containing protein [SAR324 cluster bacterium]